MIFNLKLSLDTNSLLIRFFYSHSVTIL